MEINSSKKARDNMKESEAKGFIQGKLDCMKKCGVFNKEDNINYNDCDYCHYCYSQGNFGQQKEAFSMAINALEKQIPKKSNDEIKTIPELDENGAYVDADTYVYLLCPICGNQVGIDDCIDNYCSDCGQKLE